MNRNLAIGRLHTASGRNHCMLVVPRAFVGRLAGLFAENRSVLDREDLKPMPRLRRSWHFPILVLPDVNGLQTLESTGHINQ